MKYKIKELEKILDRKYSTIKVYLDRAEFNHIEIIKNKSGRFFTNVSKKDIETLRNMFLKRQNSKYPSKGEDE